MSFRIERSHGVFKHLIHVGPEIDANAVAEIAIKHDYSKQERQIPTPRGPLKEFLFRPKTNPQSMIIYSTKGFVIDAQPIDNVLPLFRDAYDFYEQVMGDNVMTATILINVNAKFEVFSPVPVNEFINKLYVDNISNIKYGSRELRANGITLAFGTGKFPEEFIQLVVQPLSKDPQRRLSVAMMYRSSELDEALKQIDNMENDTIKTLEKISKV